MPDEKQPKWNRDKHLTVDGARVCDPPVHTWFGLTYAAYAVLPRLLLQEMPIEWQERFVALMDEASELIEECALPTPEGYVVNRRIDGKFCRDPWKDYRRGSVLYAAGKEIGITGESTEDMQQRHAALFIESNEDKE